MSRSLTRRACLAAAAITCLGVTAAPAMADPGAVFTQTNDPAGNAVQKFDRSADGRLSPAGTFSTGGAGLATLGGRQGAVELSGDGRELYAVNAGSNTISSFRVTRDGLELRDTVASGGTAPVSIDERAGRVYVLNSGATANVTGFRARHDGSLTEIDGASRDLPGALGAAQVSVTPDGEALVVSERLSNRLETLAVDGSGRLGAPVATPSNGAVPFGFAIDREGHVLVSEAGPSGFSSYALGAGGALSSITSSLLVGRGAACWVAVTPSGKYAYTGNASGSISGFRVASDGALSALDAEGLPVALPATRDLDVSRNGRFLYAVSTGNAQTGGRIVGYRIGDDGSLTELTSAPAATGITGAAAI